jgi:hypothetical protein
VLAPVQMLEQQTVSRNLALQAASVQLEVNPTMGQKVVLLASAPCELPHDYVAKT